ncbi:MAG: GIY-YIG nuclease family protein [Gammaproteobacteria bacterium]
MESVFFWIIIGGLATLFAKFNTWDKKEKKRIAHEKYLQQLESASMHDILWSYKGVRYRAGKITQAAIHHNGGKKRKWNNGSGAIYVVPAKCALYQLEYESFGDSALVQKRLKNLFDKFDYDFSKAQEEMVFKIGFTTRAVQTRLEELGENESIYLGWEFNSDKVKKFAVSRNVEWLEHLIHKELRKRDKCVFNELFLASYSEIEEIITRIVNSSKSAR